MWNALEVDAVACTQTKDLRLEKCVLPGFRFVVVEMSVLPRTEPAPRTVRHTSAPLGSADGEARAEGGCSAQAQAALHHARCFLGRSRRQPECPARSYVFRGRPMQRWLLAYEMATPKSALCHYISLAG